MPAAYGVLYIVWGSTYLAMKIAVHTLPPFLLAATRFLLSGVVLFGAATALDRTLPPTREWGRSALAGALLLLGGNATVLWAVQHVPSGVAALLVATTPLWLATLQALRTRTPPSRASVLGIALGLCGIAVLVGPQALAGTGQADPVGVIALVGASLLWALGSLVQRGGSSSALAATGMQMLCGGALLLAVSLVAGEHVDVEHVSADSVWALAYLTVFGSLLGFTSYTWLMQRDDPARVATYAYVNPVIAVALGALIAAEPLTPRLMVAAAVIIAGVVVIVRATRRR